MGDIAEWMLDGTLCEGCGEFIEGEPPGHPRYCSKECEPIDLQKALKKSYSMSSRAAKAMRHNQERRRDAKTRKPHECKACHKLFKTEAGRDHHFDVKHGQETAR